MMNVTVKLFGPQAQLADARELTIALPGDGATCAALRAALADAAPSLAPSLPASRFAVNHAYARDDQPIREGDEVALIGMVSGG